VGSCEIVGRKVGEEEGLYDTEGDAVGCADVVGEPEGLVLGLIDGLILGKLVGSLEVEGALVGASDGDKVGRCEGVNNGKESKIRQLS
jgi:hypothetical protein